MLSIIFRPINYSVLPAATRSTGFFRPYQKYPVFAVSGDGAEFPNFFYLSTCTHTFYIHLGNLRI